MKKTVLILALSALIAGLLVSCVTKKSGGDLRQGRDAAVDATRRMDGAK